MSARVGIVGASGYGGAELARLVTDHPELELSVLAAHSHAGRPVVELYPNLARDDRFAPVEPGELQGLDLVFVATPHGPAADLAPDLAGAGTPVVDVSPAFRLPPELWERAYGEAHPRPDLLPAAYGLSEWNRSAVREADLVANPGCYPTAALLALLPLAPLVEPGSVVVDAKSGTSGAGRAPGEALHHPHVDGNTAAYGLPRHRHTDEIEHHLSALGASGAPTSGGGSSDGPASIGVSAETPGCAGFRALFTPHLVPMSRGLLATCYATLRDGVTPEAAGAALEEAYREEPFVRLLPHGLLPRTKAVSGSNACHLAVIPEAGGRRVTVLSAIDNLGKGAAGQALQNANLRLGLPEGLGLSTMGVDP